MDQLTSLTTKCCGWANELNDEVLVISLLILKKYKQLHCTSHTFFLQKLILFCFISFTDNARDNAGKVLVHCHAGVSRSATVCIAYLMFKNNMFLEEAFEHVRLRRGVISPNLNFMQQLKEYETSLFGGKVYEITDSVSSISTSLASVDFDISSSSTSVSDFSATSGAFDFTFASSGVPPLSPRELVSPS